MKYSLSVLIIMSMFFATTMAQNNSLDWKPIHHTQTGQIMGYMPLPHNWQLNSRVSPGNPHVTGPNGIAVYGLGGQKYVQSNDPYAASSFQAMGYTPRNVASTQEILNEVYSKVKQQGWKHHKDYQLPEVAQYFYGYMNQLVSFGQRQVHYEVIGSDWTSANNKKACIILVINQLAQAGAVMWGYQAEVLEANPNDFESAKQAYIYACANQRSDQNSIMAYNQSERQKFNASNARFQDQQRQKNAAFQATQKAFTDASNAALDGGMESFQRRSASQDRIQRQLTDMTLEQQQMYDPQSGTLYDDVPAGANHYFINGQGQIIYTDNHLYNPNLDPNVNHQNYERMQHYNPNRN